MLEKLFKGIFDGEQTTSNRSGNLSIVSRDINCIRISFGIDLCM